MQATLNQTPTANRTHIGFFGKMNSGKSSLINALANQEISIVSEVSGTTTDPVKKSNGDPWDRTVCARRYRRF